ncbi:MAG: hypothetical protein CVU60_16005 [Deltaproteobacteria bacterium HGW-Deltaproteobacteria-18]|nr:MAG: hypothetical protein CVU60_16005 [Deltaproteobacteria bacterium HGW-Deltaproteobacteria-18]
MSFATLAEYGRDYCVIDTHNLFVGTTLEDEILLLGADDGIFSTIARECSRFGLELEHGRKLSSYSGGEQSIICCLLLMNLLPKEKLSILLVHVLETLSPRNRDLLLDRFTALLPAASLSSLTEKGPKLVTDHA